MGRSLNIPDHVPTSRIYPLQFRKIWKKMLMLEISPGRDSQKLWRSVFVSLIAIGGIFLLFSSTDTVPQPDNFILYFAVYLLVFFGLIFSLVLYEWLYIWTYYYDVDADFLRIRKGIVIRQEISVPYNRIQDVYVDQDFLDHIMMLYDLHISTATATSGLEAHIDGVNHENAEKIHALILGHIKTSNEPTKPGPGV